MGQETSSVDESLKLIKYPDDTPDFGLIRYGDKAYRQADKLQTQQLNKIWQLDVYIAKGARKAALQSAYLISAMSDPNVPQSDPHNTSALLPEDESWMDESLHGSPPKSHSPSLDRYEAMLERALEKWSLNITTQISNTLTADIKELGHRVGDLEQQAMTQKTDISTLGEELEELRGENLVLLHKLEDVENRSRRANIRIRGIPEAIVDLQSTVTALFQELVPTLPIERLESDRISRRKGLTVSHVFLKKLQQVEKGLLIVAGDSNLILHQSLDRRSDDGSSPRVKNRTPGKSFQALLGQYHLIDAWREIHPTKRDFTHYSCPHKLATRIDHIFMQHSALPQLSQANIVPISWSDHDLVSIDLLSLSQSSTQKSWKLYEPMLAYEILIERLCTEILEYFRLNTGSVSSNVMLWEAHKVVIRGILMQESARRKALYKEKLLLLTKAFNSASQDFKTRPTKQNRIRLNQATNQLNLCLSGEAAGQLNRSKFRWYCTSNKPNTPLAKRLRGIVLKPKPMCIKTLSGSLSSDPAKVVATFSKHLEGLYKSKSDLNINKAEELFAQIGLPSLPPGARELIDRPIEAGEVLEAITSLKVGKQPGPDGFSTVYYKKFSQILAPHLTTAFNALREGAVWSADSLTAAVSMIPKPNTDDSLWSNYRPISLLNVDVKILAKVLAAHLNGFINVLISKEQVGFMPQRQAGDNIRKIANLIHRSKVEGYHAMLLGLDIRENVDRKLGSSGKPREREHGGHYEIIVPYLLSGKQWKEIGTIFPKGHPSRLKVMVRSKEEELLLNLERNQGLFAGNFRMTHYTEDGAAVITAHNHSDLCYYHGEVVGFPGSAVSLSTCSGLRGLITLENQAYVLEPQANSTSRHLFYKAEELKLASGSCSQHRNLSANLLNDILQYSADFSQRHKRDTLKATKYVELVIVADNREFQRQGKDVDRVKHRLLEMANYVDKFFRPLNIRVALVGVEIWSDTDKCSITEDPFTSLHEFLDWRKLTLLPQKAHDNAQLVSGVHFQGTTIGMAPIMSMCTAQSGGVVMDHSDNPLGAAVTLAHEIGHNFGMNHDTQERGCNCKGFEKGGCIMTPSTAYPFPTVFSSCSKKDLDSSLEKGVGMCLYNMPEVTESFGEQKCGNGYVEEGEQCDCGEPEECTNPCCNATTCQLTPGAVCAHGLCCEDCKLKPGGTPCRDSNNFCDLPEFCNGSSAHCPPNVYLHDGHPCHTLDGYCYSGMCQTHEQQCVTLWGQGAKPAPGICFERVNSAGDPYGNCGKDISGSFMKCESRDAKCGKIQCQGGASRPVIGTNAVSIETNIPQQEGGKILCRGTHVYLGDDMPDPGLVLSGTKCGHGKICLNRQCQNISIFGVHNCASKCNGHGVCNNMKNCHCEAEWAPPYCDRPGYGGSVDSGPIRLSGNRSIIAGVLISITFITAAVFAIYLKRKRLLSIPARPLPAKPSTHGVQAAHIPSPPQKPLPADPLNKSARFCAAPTSTHNGEGLVPRITPVSWQRKWMEN
ncbi:disintegrin and metalloproteinase domain-containing protein 12 [Gastrophryne carolinensis]